MYVDKFSLSRKENVFLAKKELVRSVWAGVNLEGFNMTYPETETVLNHGKLTNADPDAIICANNLKRGWKYLLANFSEGNPSLDVGFLAKINEIVAANDSLDPGNLRTGTGGIGGTSYKPPIKTIEEMAAELEDVLQTCGATERALRFFAWSCKGQFWWDGNKRTSFLGANKILIESGAGILLVSTEKLQTFNEVLHEYYEHDNLIDLIDFLYEEAIEAGPFEESHAINHEQHQVQPINDIAKEAQEASAILSESHQPTPHSPSIDR